MPKTKEREAEKPAAKSSRAAAAKPAAKSSSRVQATPAKPAAKPSAKSGVATAKPAAVAPKPAAKAAEKPADKPSAKSSTKLPAAKPGKVEAKAEKAAPKPAPVVFKCPFPKDELLKWRKELLQRRGEISHDIAGLEKDAMEAEDGHTTPNHIAERGSDADLQDVSLGIAGEEKDIIWQIDRALRKIDEADPIPFGLCEFTKEPIPRNRLQLIPWTPLSIEGANHMEENGLKVEDMLVDG